MKKFLWVVAVMLLTAGVASAQGYAVAGKAGIYNVTLKIKSSPAVVGENPATIEVKDAGGRHVPAAVSLYYFMTSMPAMHYETKAMPVDHAYAAVIIPTMPGAWKLHVKVKGSDGKTHRATFDFVAK